MVDRSRFMGVKNQQGEIEGEPPLPNFTGVLWTNPTKTITFWFPWPSPTTWYIQKKVHHGVYLEDWLGAQGGCNMMQPTNMLIEQDFMGNQWVCHWCGCWGWNLGSIMLHPHVFRLSIPGPANVEHPPTSAALTLASGCEPWSHSGFHEQDVIRGFCPCLKRQGRRMGIHEQNRFCCLSDPQMKIFFNEILYAEPIQKKLPVCSYNMVQPLASQKWIVINIDPLKKDNNAQVVPALCAVVDHQQ